MTKLCATIGALLLYSTLSPLLSLPQSATKPQPVLPRPDYANSFCLFPIDEAWHAGSVAKDAELTKTIQQIREAIGPQRLYARLGIAIISNGNEPSTYALAKKLGIGLVLQNGLTDHHWGADFLGPFLHDPKLADRRYVQWFQDGAYADPGSDDDYAFGVRPCISRYAKPIYQFRREQDMQTAVSCSSALKEFPGTIIAFSGPIEVEMHNGKDHWGDYSPFTLEEFRDYLTHRGIYAPGNVRAGEGYPGGGQFARDPSPGVAAGDHPSFNQTFGTHFTTWTLRYWDPIKFPQRLSINAPGMPGPGQKGYVQGGFDAPRIWPGQQNISGLHETGDARFWSAWAGTSDRSPGFREKLVSFWVNDHTRWMADAGIPRNRIFSHQIPGESYGIGRLTQGASAVWTAFTPYSGIGITTYFGAASDSAEFRKIVEMNPNWGIFEYHPHPINSLSAPVSEYLHSLYACLHFRAHILTPIAWNSTGNDFIVNTGPFAEAMKQLMASLPDQPYYNRSYVNYSAPPVRMVSQKSGAEGTLYVWSARIWKDLPFTWPNWNEYEHFEVLNGQGRILAETKDYSVLVSKWQKGVHVVAMKKAAPPPLPVVQNVSGDDGVLRWSQCDNFFCDHYLIEVYSSHSSNRPWKELTSENTICNVPAIAGTKKLWCRAAVCDGAGRHGPFSPMVSAGAPPPGAELVDMPAISPHVSNSPDAGWRSVSVGGIVKTALFEHPPLTGGGWSRALFTITLPALKKGRNILFLSSVGIKDGAKGSDGVVFRVEAGGRTLFNKLALPDGRWHKVAVDLTALEGRTVHFTLMTNMNKNSVSDWGAWGNPQILLTGPGAAPYPTVTGILALGKQENGKVTLVWNERASDGTLWTARKGFEGYRVYRGSSRDFIPGPENLLGSSNTARFTDTHFDGSQTFYKVTAMFAGGVESPPSEAVQYAP